MKDCEYSFLYNIRFHHIIRSWGGGVISPLRSLPFLSFFLFCLVRGLTTVGAYKMRKLKRYSAKEEKALLYYVYGYKYACSGRLAMDDVDTDCCYLTTVQR